MSSGSEPVQAPPGGEYFRCEAVQDGDVGTVRVIGELDLDGVPALADEIARLREAGCSHVVIDLSELEFLDSSGLRLILDCHAEAQQDSHSIALIPGPRAVQRVFELTRTAEHLPFVTP